MERPALSGSSGTLGRRLATTLEHYTALSRDGNIPKDADVIFDLATGLAVGYIIDVTATETETKRYYRWRIIPLN